MKNSKITRVKRVQDKLRFNAKNLQLYSLNISNLKFYIKKLATEIIYLNIIKHLKKSMNHRSGTFSSLLWIVDRGNGLKIES